MKAVHQEFPLGVALAQHGSLVGRDHVQHLFQLILVNKQGEEENMETNAFMNQCILSLKLKVDIFHDNPLSCKIILLFTI